MTIYELEGYELFQMIGWLTSRGGMPDLLNFLEKVPGEIGKSCHGGLALHGKRLKFGEYRLRFAREENDGHSMESFHLGFQREARFMGWVENRKLFRFLIDAVQRRYVGEDRQVEGVHRRGGADLVGGFSKVSWGREATIKYDPWSGKDRWDKYDWINLSFYRKFD